METIFWALLKVPQTLVMSVDKEIWKSRRKKDFC